LDDEPSILQQTSTPWISSIVNHSLGSAKHQVREWKERVSPLIWTLKVPEAISDFRILTLLVELTQTKPLPTYLTNRPTNNRQLKLTIKHDLTI